MESAVEVSGPETGLIKRLSVTLDKGENRKPGAELNLIKDGSTKLANIKASFDPIRADRVTVKLMPNGNRMEPKKIGPPRISFADAISGIEAKHHEIVLQKVSKRKSIQTPLKDFSEGEVVPGKSPAPILPKTKRLSTNASTDTEDSSSKDETNKEMMSKRKVASSTPKLMNEEPQVGVTLQEKRLPVAVATETKEVARAESGTENINLAAVEKPNEATKKKKNCGEATMDRPKDAGRIIFNKSPENTTSATKTFKMNNSITFAINLSDDESLSDNFDHPKRTKPSEDATKMNLTSYIYETSDSDSESDSASFSKSVATKASSKVLGALHSERFSPEKSVTHLERKSMGPATSSSEQPLFVDDRLPEGWSRELCQRQGGLTAGKYDVYIRNPTGKKFRSRNEIRNYSEHLGLDLNPDDFDFTVFGKFPNAIKKRRKVTKTVDLKPERVGTSSATEKVAKKLIKRKSIELEKTLEASPSPFFSWEERKEKKKKVMTPKIVNPVLGSQKWTPPRSPYNLIQENLYHNPWQLLVATILLNKSSVFDDDITGKSATPIIYDFFEKWPTPESLADVEAKELADVIEPLGLHNKRARVIKHFSVDFLTKQWTYPNELYGIGKYGNDSYRMFCVNEWASVKPSDPMLTLYGNWLAINWRALFPTAGRE